MGARSGGRAASAWVGLVVLLLVSLAFIPVIIVGGQEEEEPVEDVVYFTQRRGSDPEYNFSTYAPKIEETTVREGVASGDFGLEVSWGWWLPTAPANWSVESGAEWEVILHIGGWDEHLPIASPISNPDAIGQHRVQVNLTMGNSLVASGAIYRDADPVNDGVERVVIPIEFVDSFDFRRDEGSDTMLLDVRLTGRRMDSDATMDLHYGSTEFSSRIETSGYPVEHLRIWEDQLLWKEYCAEKQLEQEVCEPESGPPPTNGGPGATGNPSDNSTGRESVPAGAPGAILIPSLAIGALLLLPLVRKRRTE